MSVSARLSPPPKRPEELGFYMANSPFAKIAEQTGLDFNADKETKKAAPSIQAQANDVFEEHHQGRRWAETLALMAAKTGAYRELTCVVKTPYGGVDEDGVHPWIPQNIIQEAKEIAMMRTRVAARKFAGKPKEFSAEKAKIGQDLLVKIASPSLLTRLRDKHDGSDIRDGEVGSPTNIMDALNAQMTPR
uniref:Uncharacterized protein n=1 Tax=Haptolina brevifila TaxID=156173 RepID=A0A7S2DR54_9EUKA|mmetsp:Transcript_4174/g.9112  ORF Transcript_4174/g.9112 Transcript_4174/m.9112 type:complete len:190 (+) Transcript_4174:40-609(+)